jgi:hypothetical protein
MRTRTRMRMISASSSYTPTIHKSSNPFIRFLKFSCVSCVSWLI